MEGGIVLRFSTIHVCFNVIELEISLYAFILALFLYILNYLYFVFELLFAMFPSPFFFGNLPLNIFQLICTPNSSAFINIFFVN